MPGFESAPMMEQHHVFGKCPYRFQLTEEVFWFDRGESQGGWR